MNNLIARDETKKELLSEDVLARAALKARQLAYAPYSHYQVGAALLCEDGTLYLGGNIENASYGASNCAERTAIFKAVSDGKTDFRAIAVAGGPEGEDPVEYAYPCGICRQVMQEFVHKDFQILVVKSATEYQVFRMEELFPHAFNDRLM